MSLNLDPTLSEDCRRDTIKGYADCRSQAEAGSDDWIIAQAVMVLRDRAESCFRLTGAVPERYVAGLESAGWEHSRAANALLNHWEFRSRSGMVWRESDGQV